LQKDLRDGTVGLNDVMKFVVKLSDDHREAALKMADSGMDAGQKLTVAMQRLQLHLGRIMQPIGAFFQKLATAIINSVNRIIEGLGRLFNIGTENQRTNLENRVKTSSDAYTLAIRQGLDKSTDPRDKARFNRIKRERDAAMTSQQTFYAENPSAAPASSEFDDPTSAGEQAVALAKVKQELGLISEQEVKNLEIKQRAKEIYDEQVVKLGEINLTLPQIEEKLRNNAKASYNFKEELRKVVEAATDLGTNMEQLVVSSVSRLGDEFANLVVTGKASFAELTRSILADLQKMIIKALLFKAISKFTPLGKFLNFGQGGVVDGGEVTKSAKGNVFAKNKIVPYAMGGIVDRPTIFPMAKGMGLMGEAGPEAVMPLKRGANGKLGVQASGGVSNVVVNVDASGTAVEGDEAGGKELGRLIGLAVQSELLEQKRPGGLLS